MTVGTDSHVNRVSTFGLRVDCDVTQAVFLPLEQRLSYFLVADADWKGVLVGEILVMTSEMSSLMPTASYVVIIAMTG
jgi:hypothetical protein